MTIWVKESFGETLVLCTKLFESESIDWIENKTTSLNNSLIMKFLVFEQSHHESWMVGGKKISYAQTSK